MSSILVLIGSILFTIGTTTAQVPPVGPDRPAIGGVVRLSPFIGDTLDLYDREMYDLSFDVENFEWAVFSMGEDDMVSAWVSMRRDTLHISRFFPNYRRYDDLVKHVHEIEQGFLRGSREGTRIAIRLPADSLEGTLLAVRESVILVAREDFGDDDVFVVPRNQIQRCVRPGHSNVLKGMGYGALAGAGTAALLSLPGGSSNGGGLNGIFDNMGIRALFLGIVFVPVGTLIGTLSGALSYSYESDIDFTDTHGLKTLSKYPLGEPEYLKAVR